MINLKSSLSRRLRPLMVAVSITLLPLITLAQEEAHGEAHGEGLPMVVYLQAINFVLYAGLIVYFARKPVKDYFTGRQEKFNSALTKAAAAKAEAEARKREMQNKIDSLQASSAQELARAKSEAEALSVRIVKEAEEISMHLQTEANRTASFEIERAKNELRDDLLKQAVAFSSKLLKDKMADADQKRLQTEFVDKIGANR